MEKATDGGQDNANAPLGLRSTARHEREQAGGTRVNVGIPRPQRNDENRASAKKSTCYSIKVGPLLVVA
jgi:hypothetical protein